MTKWIERCRRRAEERFRRLDDVLAAMPDDPDLFMQWQGPDSLDGSTIAKWDWRTGGEWRDVSTMNDEEFGFHGCGHEVRENECIIQTFTFEGFADGVSLERLDLEDLGDGRTRLTATSLVDSFEGRDVMVASGAAEPATP